MDRIGRDLRRALRLALRDRTYTATVVLTLALCIGANTALFAVVYNVLLRPLPVPQPGRVVLMSNLYPKAGVVDSSNSGVPSGAEAMVKTRFGPCASFSGGSISVIRRFCPASWAKPGGFAK